MGQVIQTVFKIAFVGNPMNGSYIIVIILNSFLHPFLKSKFLGKIPWHRNYLIFEDGFSLQCHVLNSLIILIRKITDD